MRGSLNEEMVMRESLNEEMEIKRHHIKISVLKQRQ
jgi:hypothetical protein